MCTSLGILALCTVCLYTELLLTSCTVVVHVLVYTYVLSGVVVCSGGYDTFSHFHVNTISFRNLTNPGDMVSRHLFWAGALSAFLLSLSSVCLVTAEDLNAEFANVEAVRNTLSDGQAAGGSAPAITSPVRKSQFGLNGDISETGSYHYEMFFGALLLVYLLLHLYGRSVNKRIMDSWLARYDSYFSGQFEASGDPDTAHAPTNMRQRFFQESGNEFTYYATGRDHLASMHFKFNLRHRQDLIMHLYDTVLFPVDDKVTVEIVLADDRKCDPALFAVLAKSKVVSFRDQHSSLKEFMVATQHPALGGGLVLLSENAECAKELLPDKVLEAIVASEEYFESLFVTDLNSTAPQGYTATRQNVLFCTFKLPSDPSLVVPLFEMLLPLVDHISNVKLSLIAKGRVDKNRRLVKEQLDKLELEKAKASVEQKKQEKLEKEKLLYDTLSPQERAKLDDKEEKRKKKDEDKKRFKKKSV